MRQVQDFYAGLKSCGSIRWPEVADAASEELDDGHSKVTSSVRLVAQ